MLVFKNDDDSYRKWLIANPNGFVLNTEQIPVARYLKLHRVACPHIKAWADRNPTSTSYIITMGRILRERGLTMRGYVEYLRRLDGTATSMNPMPALDAIIRDHRATGWKTLSVFVRDCVGGHCFPIDSRVRKELERHSLPSDAEAERLLVSLSLAIGRRWPEELGFAVVSKK